MNYYVVYVFVAILILAFLITKTSSTTPTPTLPPVISNLEITQGAGTQNQTLSWEESGGTVDNRYYVIGNVSDYVEFFTSGFVDLQNLDNSFSEIEVTIKLSNAVGQTQASINISNPCFLGHILLMTNQGPKEAKHITIGDLLLQPDNSYSAVKEIKHSTIKHKGNNFENDRLFADSEEKMIVTYWHKIKFFNELEEQMAGKHEKLHEVFYDFPFDVYNFKLEHFTHKILIADTEIIAESFIPVNPK